jgi:tetratricopeptide (TPR) repeat protein
MTGYRRPDPDLDALVAAVEERATVLHHAASEGDAGASAALVDGAFEYLDRGLLVAATPIIERLDALSDVGNLSASQQGWLTNLHARVWFSTGGYDQAIGALTAIVAGARESGDAALLGTTFLNLGNAYWARGSLTEAEGAFRESINVRDASDGFGRAQGWINLAGVFLDRGDIDAAVSAIDRASALPAAGRGRLRASLAGVRGLVAAAEGTLDRAKAEFEESARVASRVGALEHLAVALQNLGAVNLDLGLAGRATRYLRRAERVAAEMSLGRLLDSIQRTLATALQRLGRARDAQVVLERAIAAALSRDDLVALARVRADTGALLVLEGRHREAVAPLSVALDAFLRVGDGAWAQNVAKNLAGALVDLDDEARAVRTIRQVAEGLRLADRPKLELEESIGDMFLGEGHIGAAIRAYERAREYLPASEVVPADYLAETASKVGNVAPSEATRLYSAALELYRDGTGVIARYHMLNDRALLFAQLGAHARAREDLLAALDESTEVGDRAMRTLVLRNLSEVLRRDGEVEPAVGYAEQGLAVAEHLGNRLETAWSLATLGLALAAAGDWVGARPRFEASVKLARSLRLTEVEAIALGGLAQSDFAKGRYRTARRRYRAAAQIEQRLGDRQHETETYAALVEVDALLRDEEAFEDDLQRLVDLVQKEDGSLDVAENGMSRAARAWLRRRGKGPERAGETFALAILLRLWQAATSGPDALPEGFAGPFVAPYIYAASVEERSMHRIEVSLLSVIREKAGGRGERVVRELLAAGREAASAAMANKTSE